MNIIGIDPGKHGAINLLQNGSLGLLTSLEGIKPQDLPLLFTGPGLGSWPVDGVFIEDVHASPQQGVVSAFTFGKGFGMLLAACYMAFPADKVHLVRPATWQAALGCMAGGDKGKLFERAKQEFPGAKFKKEHADAVLISLYGFKHLQHNPLL